MIRRWVAAVGAACLACGAWPAGVSAAPLPLHAYEFRSGFSDSGSGNTAIVPEGGAVGEEYFAFDPVYPDDIYEGLTLQNPELSDVGVYSIEMRLRLDTLRNETPPGAYGEDQGWIKVLDYTNNAFSQGLYIEDVVRWGGPGAEGKIEFIASGGRLDGYDYVGVSPNGVIKADTWFHTVLTRDAAGRVACFVDGVMMFEFQDVWNDAVLDAPGATLRFMQPDDYALTTWPYPVIEVTQGDIDYLRIYDQTLSDQEAIALFQPSLVGDYSNDGRVDAADYTVWRDNLGVEAGLPNDSVGGLVGPLQYENWRANYGAGFEAVLATGNAATAPEPRAAWLAALALLHRLSLARVSEPGRGV